MGIPKEVKGAEFDDFETFILEKFGSGISKHFMLPYNRKLWGRDLKRLAADWTAERVAGLDQKEKFKTSGGKRTPLQPNTTVGYPAKGGFGEIFKALGKKVKNIAFGKRVVKVDTSQKIVTCSDGTSYEYVNLVNTISIPVFLNLIEETPKDLHDVANTLDYLSMKLGLVVINHPVDTDIQRFIVLKKPLVLIKLPLITIRPTI